MAGVGSFISVYVRVYYVWVVIFFAFSRTEARCLIRTLHYTSCNVTFIAYTVLHNLKNEHGWGKPTSELISFAVTLNFVVRKLHQVGSGTDFICKPIATLSSFLMFTSMRLMFICRHTYNLCWLVYMLSSILFLHAFPISPRTWCPLSFLSAPSILYHHPVIWRRTPWAINLLTCNMINLTDARAKRTVFNTEAKFAKSSMIVITIKVQNK
jgi:hypothetical protein